MPNRKALFLTPASLGGKLTLLNANLWIIFFLLLQSQQNRTEPWPDAFVSILIISMLLLSLPFGTCVMLPSLGTSSATVSSTIFAATVLGLNAFAWGYGLAWCIEKMRLLIRPKS